MTQPGDTGVGGNVDAARKAEDLKEDQQGGAAGLWRQFTGGGETIVGPNEGAYNKQLYNAQNQAGGFLGQGDKYAQAGATINDAYQGASRADLAGTESGLRGLGGYYQNILTGAGPTVAQNQYQQSQDKAIQAQMAMANSARGGGAAQAGAARAAALQGGTQLAGAAAQSGIIRAQEQQAAAQGLGQTYGQLGQIGLGQYGTEMTAAEQQAGLQQQNQAQVNAMRLGLYGAGMSEQQMAQSALDSYTRENLAAQGIQMQSNQAATEQGGQMVSATAGAAEGMAMASDERLKKGSLSEGFMSDENAKQNAYNEGMKAGQGGTSTPQGYNPNQQGGQAPTYPSGGQGQAPGQYQVPGGGLGANDKTYQTQGAYNPATYNPGLYARLGGNTGSSTQAMPAAQGPAYDWQHPPKPQVSPWVPTRGYTGDPNNTTYNAPFNNTGGSTQMAPPAPPPAGPASAALPPPQTPGAFQGTMSDEFLKTGTASEGETKADTSLDVPQYYQAKPSGGLGATLQQGMDAYKKAKGGGGGATAGGTPGDGSPNPGGSGTGPAYGENNAFQDVNGPSGKYQVITNSPWDSDAVAAKKDDMFYSDRNLKTSNKRTLADEFLDHLHPHSYNYKNPQDEPRPIATGGRYLGTMAQDMERTPEVGHQIIMDTPRGKMVAPKAALSAALAGLGRLNERVKMLETSGGSGGRK